MKTSELKHLKLGQDIRRTIPCDGTESLPFCGMGRKKMTEVFNDLYSWTVVGKTPEGLPIAMCILSGYQAEEMLDRKGKEVKSHQVENGLAVYDDAGTEWLVMDCGCGLSDMQRNGLLKSKETKNADTHMIVRTAVLVDGFGWEVC